MTTVIDEKPAETGTAAASEADWQRYSAGFTIRVVMPLDEISERAYLEGFGSPAFKMLLDDLVFEAEVADDFVAQLKVLSIRDVSEHYPKYVSIGREQDVIAMILAVEMVYESESEFTASFLKEAVSPQPSMPTLYGELTTQLPDEEDEEQNV